MVGGANAPAEHPGWKKMGSSQDMLLNLQLSGRIARVTLNRPDKFNSLSVELIDQFHGVLSKVEEEKARAILIDANGKHFCTGADLADVLSSLSAGETSLDALLRRGQELFLRLENSPIPVIVAVQGLCLAGGLELLLASDVAIAAASASFGDQHINFGFLPGWGASKRLPSTVGLRRASDLMFSGRKLNAQEALDWGLVNAVVRDEELQAHATAYCVQLAACSSSALAAMKTMLRKGSNATLEDALRRERELVIKQLQSADGREGLAAFREKRKPAFD